MNPTAPNNPWLEAPTGAFGFLGTLQSGQDYLHNVCCALNLAIPSIRKALPTVNKVATLAKENIQSLLSVCYNYGIHPVLSRVFSLLTMRNIVIGSFMTVGIAQSFADDEGSILIVATLILVLAATYICKVFYPTISISYPKWSMTPTLQNSINTLNQIARGIRTVADRAFTQQGVGVARIALTVSLGQGDHRCYAEIGRGGLEVAGYGSYLALIDLVHLALSGGSAGWWQGLLRAQPVRVNVAPPVVNVAPPNVQNNIPVHAGNPPPQDQPPAYQQIAPGGQPAQN